MVQMYSPGNPVAFQWHRYLRAMNFLPEEIEQYCEDKTRRGPAYLDQLARTTWQETVMPRMLSGHLQGRFLSMISCLMKPSRILEVGTFTGYSALCLAEGLAAGGYLVTMDVNDELAGIQDRYFSQSPFAGQIRRVFGNALELIPGLTESFDIAFVDADKENYPRYFDLILPKMRTGGCILFDNVLWSGKVVRPAEGHDPETAAIRELNDRVLSDARVENVLLPLRDGVMMIRVK